MPTKPPKVFSAGASDMLEVVGSGNGCEGCLFNNGGEGGGGDTQDGGDCPVGTATTGVLLAIPIPETNPPTGNVSLIGPAPFDLGGRLLGGLRAPVLDWAPTGTMQSGILAQSPLAARPNHGVAFAKGKYGVASPTTGAFVHPFTLLALPSDVDGMGLRLRIVYLSNAFHVAGSPQPFGPGFFLSGFDHLQVTDMQGSQIKQVALFRGDGSYHGYDYDVPSGKYLSPAGAMDELVWDASVPGFYRFLPDGRRIRYFQSTTGNAQIGTRFLRDEVRSLADTTITYGYDMTKSPPELSWIEDTRRTVTTPGVRIVFTWGAPQTGKRRITKIAIDPSTLDTTNLYPPASQTDLEIDLSYVGSMAQLSQIELFPFDAVRDANSDGTIDLTSEKSVGVRPTIALEYGEQGLTHTLLSKIKDATYSGAVETRLRMQYSENTGTGDWQVWKVIEGDSPTTDPVHTFLDYDQQTQRRCVSPRNTTTTMTLDSAGRITQVAMAADAAGKPRDAGDHDSLVWSITYSCGCSLPSSVTTPEQRSWSFTWDETRGLLKTQAGRRRVAARRGSGR